MHTTLDKFSPGIFGSESTKVNKTELPKAKPFLKWAGGKTQLLDVLISRLPDSIKKSGTIKQYVEPFVGGGAMFFALKSKFEIEQSVLIDVNPELIVGYAVIQNSPGDLIDYLEGLQEKYLAVSEDSRKSFYYNIRNHYNKTMMKFDYNNYSEDWIERASHLIALNKTCFNGLFRQNAKGGFNVPFGKYKNPSILNKKNIMECHKALKDTVSLRGDFENAVECVKKGTLVYLDPPYRPLNNTASFTSYSKGGFTDDDQKRLAKYYKKMDKIGAHLILSNSDPKNESPEDNFFDELYKEYTIERVPAKRSINCDATKRGKISELIIRNYGE